MKIQKRFYFLILLFFAYSCANPVVPTGGAKDAVPPKIKNAFPQNLSKQVKPSKINIQLDEYFILDNPIQNITISPPIDRGLQFVVKGKNLLVKIPEGSLQDSTTYTINFGAAIKDNNEGNVQDSFKFVFSTGSFLDSSLLIGNIKDVFSNLSSEGYLVGLYPIPMDSLTEKPFYYTKTDKEGNFRLDNLKQGTYEVMAFKDENSNLTRDLMTENLAFLNDPLLINDSTLPISMLSFQEEQILQLTEYDTKQAGFFQFVFNQPVFNVNFSPIDTFDTFPLKDTFLFYNATKDTLRLYYADSKKSNGTFLLHANDTFSDTIKYFIKHPTQDSIRKYIAVLAVLSNLLNVSKKGISKLSSNSLLANINLGKMDYQRPVMVTLNRPISRFNLDKISMTEDTIVFNDMVSVDSLSPMRFLFHVKQGQSWKPDKSYKIMLNDSFFIDKLGNHNKPIQLFFSTTKPDDYGSISIKIDSLKIDKQYIMQFFTDKNKILQQETINNKTTNAFTYKKLLPGKYYVRLIIDENKNNQWDTGNYRQQLQPETVINFNEPVEIRAKWDNEISFILGGNRKKRP